MKNGKQQRNLRNEVILLLLIQNHLLKDEDVHPIQYSKVKKLLTSFTYREAHFINSPINNTVDVVPSPYRIINKDF